MATKKYWVVTVVKWPHPLVFDWPDGFFPRKFVYKKDAENLQKQVKAKGGIATVTKER
jgi:hypothetical protein